MTYDTVTPFLNRDFFAENITITPADGSPKYTIRGLVDRDFTAVAVGGGVEIESENISVSVAETDVENHGLAEDDTVQLLQSLPDNTYTVRDIYPDDHGFTRLILDQD